MCAYTTMRSDRIRAWGSRHRRHSENPAASPQNPRPPSNDGMARRNQAGHHLMSKLLPPKLRAAIAAKLRRHLRALGFPQARDVAAVDLRGASIDPLAALERANTPRVLVDVPLSRFRAFQEIGFDVRPEGPNPFVRTVRWLRTNPSGTYASSPLASYYASVQPQTGVDLLGVDNEHLLALPAIWTDAPWRSASGKHVYRRRDNTTRTESRAYRHDLCIEDGWRFFGPVSEAMGEFELNRLKAVHDSISDRGYHVSPLESHMTGRLLRDGDTWAVFLMQGQHRTCAAAALGYVTLPIILRPHGIVDRRKAADWPAVQQGALNAGEARQVFDRILWGTPPPYVASRWK